MAKRKPTRTPPDWKKLLQAWASFDGPLAEFCRNHPISETSARRHKFHKLDKATVRKEAKAQADQVFDEMVKGLADKEAGDYVKTLKAAGTALEEITTRSLRAFIAKADSNDWRSPGEAARVAIDAQRELRAVNSELIGIPERSDDYVWPLTKGFDPLRHQRDFIFDFPSTILKEEGRKVFVFCFMGGVGSGKTHSGVEKAGMLAAKNRGIGPINGVIYAPTYKILNDATKPKFFEVLAAKDIPFKYHASENAVTLWGDTKILFRSMDDPKLLKGPTICWALMDEAGSLRNRDAFDVISARVRHPGAIESCIIITTTPDGLNWLNEVVITNAEETQSRVYSGATKANYHLPEGYYERLLSTYDERLAIQELEGKPINLFAGKAYWAFTREKSVLDHKKIMRNVVRKWKPTNPLILACDFNVDPMSWNVGIEVPHLGDVRTYWFDELHMRTASTEEASEEFCRKYGRGKGWRSVVVYGDAAGYSTSTKSTAATRTDYQIIENRFKSDFDLVEIEVGNYNPRESVRVATVNSRIKDATGLRKMFFSHRMKYTLQDLDQVSFIPGSRQLDKSNPELTHHSDAIGYYTNKCFPVFGPEVRTGKRKAA